ncbi:MAG: polysaccharide pyruvyl transferase family protein [Specibacter sp.]
MNAGPIYLVAPSGNPNFGDEIIAAAWLRHLAKAAPDTEVYLDCPQPGTAQILFAGLHPLLHVTNTLWRAVADSAALPPAEMGERVAQLVRDTGSPQYDLGLLKLREAQSLHLLGGGYINNMWPQHYGLVRGLQAVRELTGARLFATGLGLMPADAELPVEAANLFAGFDYASARDADSAKAFGLKFGLDDAFLGAAAEIGRNPAAANSLCVCIQNDTVDDGHLANVLGYVRARVQAAVDSGREVHYFEAIPGPDRAAFEALADLIPESHFVPFVETWRHGLPVHPGQEWLTTRFHFHLLAAAAGAKGTSVEAKAGYYNVKHGSVRDLGSGWAHVANGAEVTPATSNAMQGKLPDLAGRKLAEAQKLYPQAPWKLADESLGKALFRSVRRAGARA